MNYDIYGSENQYAFQNANLSKRHAMHFSLSCILSPLVYRNKKNDTFRFSLASVQGKLLLMDKTFL